MVAGRRLRPLGRRHKRLTRGSPGAAETRDGYASPTRR
jgi:hypothetical protein